MNYATQVSQAQSAPFLSIALEGQLQFDQEERKNERVVRALVSILRLRLDGLSPNADTHSPSTESTRAQLTQVLQTPFFLEYSLSGDFRGVRMTAKGPAIATQLWQALGSALQFHRGPAGSATWTATEIDGVGRYLASYRLENSGIAERKKLSYHGYHANSVGYAVPESTARFTFDTHGTVRQFEHHEVVQSRAAGPIPSFRSTTELRLALASDQREHRLSPASIRFESYALHPVSTPALESAGLEVDRQKVGSRSVDGIFVELLSSSGSSDAERERRGRAYAALVAYIRLHSMDLGEIESHALSDRQKALLVASALRDAGTPEAQHLMARLVDDNGHLNPQTKALLVQGLSLVSSPTAETVAKLTSLQMDTSFGTQATYGLGSNAHRLASTDPQAADAVVNSLLNRLNDEPSAGRKRTVLIALGAAGNSTSLSAISRYATDEREELRSAAAQALRRIPGEEADSILGKLATDSSDDVRYSALDAISERVPSASLENTVSNSALNDARVKNRFKAVEIIGQWLNVEPQLRSVLQRVAARSGEDAQVLRLAMRYLGATDAKN